MKPYTNKTDRIDDRKCLYSEIKLLVVKNTFGVFYTLL